MQHNVMLSYIHIPLSYHRVTKPQPITGSLETVVAFGCNALRVFVVGLHHCHHRRFVRQLMPTVDRYYHTVAILVDLQREANRYTQSTAPNSSPPFSTPSGESALCP